MNEDRCVVCGEIIPEGRMVCHKCEYIEQGLTQSKKHWLPNKTMKNFYRIGVKD